MYTKPTCLNRKYNNENSGNYVKVSILKYLMNFLSFMKVKILKTDNQVPVIIIIINVIVIIDVIVIDIIKKVELVWGHRGTRSSEHSHSQ